ncbi:MAG: DnaJ family molecular chaperone [Acidimicrobiales bacterium]
MALWSRKRDKADGSADGPAGEPAESVNLDDDEHAWWAQTDVDAAWTPREPARPEPGATSTGDRDILAEHFGDDWRTSFLYTPPSDEEVEEERRREQQRLDDQDPYKVLEVREDATWDEIVAAHRHQARVHHPDRLVDVSDDERARGEERIRVINQAYQELRVRRGM